MKNDMPKLYRCAKGCGSIEETDKTQIPVCCGVEMAEISEDELFGCAGCCHCCAGCGEVEVQEEKSDNSKK